MQTIKFSHWINSSHRLVGHAGKCQRIHGHNYKITVAIKADLLNDLGMVIDFGDVKSTIGKWLDDNWDHRLLLWENDPLLNLIPLTALEPYGAILVPFNPTAENMAKYLLDQQPFYSSLYGERGTMIISIEVEETINSRALVTAEEGY
jgi:6-pyruvoyltetrahydropterin/6-carboxytetrahydropterin synthase